MIILSVTRLNNFNHKQTKVKKTGTCTNKHPALKQKYD